MQQPLSPKARSDETNEAYEKHKKTPEFKEFKDYVKSVLNQKPFMFLPNTFKYDKSYIFSKERTDENVTLWIKDITKWSELDIDNVICDMLTKADPNREPLFSWFQNSVENRSVHDISHLHVFTPSKLLIYENDGNTTFCRIIGCTERIINKH